MTYIELLKHIMAKSNLARVELAFILKIPYKDFLKVLNGEKELTKKQLKLLSVFSGIPVESIISGNFVLSDDNEQNTNGFLNGFNPAIPGTFNVPASARSGKKSGISCCREWLPVPPYSSGAGNRLHSRIPVPFSVPA